MNGQPSSRSVVAPEGDLYWAVIDAQQWGIPRSRRARVGRPVTGSVREKCENLFARYVPAPIEDVQCAFVWADNGQVIGCGISRADLDALVADAVPPPLIAQPNALPESVCDAIAKIPNASAFNLLTASFEPDQLKTLRAGRRLCVCLMLVSVCAALSWGMHRRKTWCLGAAKNFDRLVQEVQRQAIDPRSYNPNLPLEAQFLSQLRRLQQTRSSAAVETVTRIPRADHVLQRLLENWPNELYTSTEVLAVTPELISLRFAVPLEQAEAAIASFKSWGDWQLAQPEISNRAAVSNVVLRWQKRAKEVADAS